MTRASAFVLLANLDAEDELAHGRPRRSRATLDALAKAAERLRALVPRGAEVVAPGARLPRDAAASAWCPTPSALAELTAAGALPSGPTPAAAVLARANARATFALWCPLESSGARSAVAADFTAVEALVQSASRDVNWLLRRDLCAAGRGARRVRGGALLAPGDAAWLRASLALGPVTLDPVVAIVAEHALHGWLEPSGAVRLGVPTVQSVDAHGAWGGSVRAEGVERSALAALLRPAAERVAAELHTLGYAGPFGLDAYHWRAADGSVALRAPSEVNARYSMGWWIGMGEA